MAKRYVGILTKGDQINDTYTVQFFIGQGAFGEVYRISHKYLGTQVLKVFKDEYVQRADIETVTREAKILSKLTHPNIVRVFETNTFEKNGINYFFMTMGFVSGETLAQLLIRKIELPVPIALSIQKDLLTGLHVTHSQTPPIIHRDISPDNVLLSYEGEKTVAMLSDFGLAQFSDYASHISTAAGKYTYFAPECFWDTYLPASDVFAAGIVLYRMITGVHPWEYNFDSGYDDPEEIATMIISSRKKSPKKPSFYADGCNDRLDEVIMKSLEKDLENRYKNASEFLEALTGLEKPASTKSVANRADEHKKAITPLTAEGTPRNYKVRQQGKGFDEIAGMHELKETLYHDVILPLTEKELYEQYKVSVPNGMLLYGPPGCGKTFIAQKFADEVGYNFITINPSDLASIYVHGTQEKIGKLFSEAREKAPTIIFIDEVDAILPKREGDLQHSYASEVNEFLAQMTECGKAGIFIIAATNRPDKIDSAITRTGRLDKVVYLSPPDKPARIEMLQLYFKDRPIDSLDFEKLAELTESYVSSDISFLVNESARDALKERTRISQSHIENAIQRHQPSVSLKQIKLYERFKNNRSFD
ncbi:MAG: hypothetical protein A2X85_17435 [Geobacteraceae bacterium GWF2_54_21]|nr:MAG: hypothetical protein A2X85_17435 [Geobacteraceae bacterium GWF2_54_21]